MATTAAPSPGTQDVPITRVATASLIGTTIEFYDFFIFGTASALVFGRLFFPSLSPLAGTLASFAAFGVAFAARPLGALIFGHFGDRVSRKQMLVTTVVMMGVSTVAVGCLPTYDTIGVAAPILLVCCRLVQGIALGGEWGGAVLMAAEHAPRNRRAFYASWPQVGVPLGLVMGTALFYGIQRLPASGLESLGWRIPFLASTVLVVVGLYIRLKIDDSPAFRVVKKANAAERFPAAVVLRSAPKALLFGALANAATGVLFYMATTFAYTYGSHAGFSHGSMLLAVGVASLIEVGTIPVVGAALDRYGRRPVLMTGCAATIVWAFPFFALIDTGNIIALIISFLVALPVCHALVYTPTSSFVPELYPTRLRYSGAAMSQTLGVLAFSAPVPFIAATVFSATSSAWPLAIYIIAGGALNLIVVILARETKNDPTHWTDRPTEARALPKPATEPEPTVRGGSQDFHRGNGTTR